MPAAAPDGLGDRGRELWAWLDTVLDLGTAGAHVVAHEACRVADRLEKLDRFLTGESDSWLDFVERPEGSGRVVVMVDNVLGEARQQQGRLTAVLAQLGVEYPRVASVPGGEGSSAGGSEGGVVTSILAARGATP